VDCTHLLLSIIYTGGENMSKEITEDEFQIQMAESIERYIRNLARNQLYYETYLSMKNKGHSFLFYESEDGSIFYVLLTQPLANHEDETMMIA